VTGVAPGSATVTATSEGQSGTASVTVTAVPDPVGSADLNPPVAVLPQGAVQRLFFTLRAPDGTVLDNRPTTWTSSNSSVAIVDSEGYLTAISVGTVRVTATREGLTASTDLTVVPPSNGPVLQVSYTSPGRASSPADQLRYEHVLDRLANDATFAWLPAHDRDQYRAELALYRSAARDYRYFDPMDGSLYPGASPGSLSSRAENVAGMIQRMRDFFFYHTGRQLRIAPLQVVPLEQSAMFYWTPMIRSDTDVDRNPIVNEISAEMRRRGFRMGERYSDTISVYVMDGGGGWAGAWQFSQFGGLAAIGDFSNCLDNPDAPDLVSSEALARWPHHLKGIWFPCSYNLALGTFIHEIGHTFGLPHPADQQCAGLGEALVMQSHWHTDLSQPAFRKPVPGITTNLGILKVWSADECKPTNNSAGFAGGLETIDGKKFQTELGILMNNPHFRF